MRTLFKHLAPAAAAIVAAAIATRIVVSSAGTDVVTYHNDNARTGQNLTETSLTPANVNSGLFGKIAVLTLDGKVDAQPLFLSGLNIPGLGARDVLYVATEHGTMFAIDAAAGSAIWAKSLLGAGETPSEAVNCGQTPEIGITAPRSSTARGALHRRDVEERRTAFSGCTR
jgi:outer membrane protein assembly factor BamB